MAKKDLSADFTRVRQHNKALILNYLRASGGSSRANLAAHSGLTRATASSLVNELIEQGWVYDVGLQQSSGGRPGTRVELNPQAGCAIGIEIQNDFIAVILADFVAHVRWCERIPLDDYSLPSALSRAEILIEEAIRRGQNEGLSPLGIAVGLPGMVDTHQGVLVFAPNLGWRDVPVRSILMERFNVPVYVHNEATMTALGESYFGTAHGCPNFIYVDTAMRGIGTGIMFDGRLFLGSNGYAGEAGHMLIQLDGKPCACGRRGCWETLVSGQAVLERAAERIASGERSLLSRRDSPLTLEALGRAAKQDDPLAHSVLQETSRLLAAGLANLVNIFNPQLIVLGGVLSHIIEPYLEMIAQTVKSEALYPLAAAVDIKVSSMGVDTCVMGAVATVLDEFHRPWFNGDR